MSNIKTLECIPDASDCSCPESPHSINFEILNVYNRMGLKQQKIFLTGRAGLRIECINPDKHKFSSGKELNQLIKDKFAESKLNLVRHPIISNYNFIYQINHETKVYDLREAYDKWVAYGDHPYSNDDFRFEPNDVSSVHAFYIPRFPQVPDVINLDKDVNLVDGWLIEHDKDLDGYYLRSLEFVGDDLCSPAVSFRSPLPAPFIEQEVPICHFQISLSLVRGKPNFYEGLDPREYKVNLGSYSINPTIDVELTPLTDSKEDVDIFPYSDLKRIDHIKKQKKSNPLSRLSGKFDEGCLINNLISLPPSIHSVEYILWLVDDNGSPIDADDMKASPLANDGDLDDEDVEKVEDHLFLFKSPQPEKIQSYNISVILKQKVEGSIHVNVLMME